MSHEKIYLEHGHESPDQWHRHTSQEGAPQAEHLSQVNARKLSLNLVFMLVFVLGTTLITAVYFIQHIGNLKHELRETTILSTQQIEYRTAAMSQQDQFAWENAEDGTVRIPVKQAMEKVVEEYQRQEARRDDG